MSMQKNKNCNRETTWQKKLTIDMGFNKIENCFKNVNVFPNHQRAKVAKNRNFLNEISLFSVMIILRSTISMSCHTLKLERTFKTEQNGIYFIEICSYMMNISPL